MVTVKDLIKDLDEVCLCPECGREIGCYSHFCEGCKERVAIPDDGSVWLKYFKEKYKLKT